MQEPSQFWMINPGFVMVQFYFWQIDLSGISEAPQDVILRDAIGIVSVDLDIVAGAVANGDDASLMVCMQKSGIGIGKS